MLLSGAPGVGSEGGADEAGLLAQKVGALFGRQVEQAADLLEFSLFGFGL